ncbi:mechanosensitive ion channel family protein [Erythrobacter sp. SCSIO 43205]|uniref:mechanosensitive ion channel family protein n=1 Tax=Erythrobacter sp. SCSIO 43205 TaxID=2779361 RepID=UPI001CA80C1E|nr:mechanosensitive ion channel domain-containing protein [Erythrobacter sp. SCSIO 43205]UAB78288.1 mechanosensitive ion channel family protein [Erythrobacter sp. SCSIO 43205]
MEQLLAFFSAQPLWAQSVIGVTGLLIASLLVNFILKDVILRIAAPYLDRKSSTIDRSATWFATVAPLLVISKGIGFVPGLEDWAVELISDVSQSVIVLSIAMGIVKALTYVNEVYERRPQAKNRPIKGYLQVVKIIVLCGAVIILISILINESPFLLLSGLGAITAVLLLVFKDTILSLVASVQLSTNDMLRVGDWITMTSMGADGTVIDISLHTVKVQNFDKTIVSIPTYRLVADSYQNWRGMAESGGRRIKRALHLDQNSVRFLSDEEVLDLKKFKMLKAYLADKREEIAEWNARELEGEDAPVNARRLTNLGTLRAYIEAYLRWHPHINNDFTLMVRQLAPGPQGVSLELYCFTDTTAWEIYEGIQADIFDHLIAIVSEFDLQLFQEPSGSDYARLVDRGS